MRHWRPRRAHPHSRILWVFLSLFNIFICYAATVALGGEVSAHAYDRCNSSLMATAGFNDSAAQQFVFQTALELLYTSFASSEAAASLVRRGYAHNVLEYAAMLAMRGNASDCPFFRELLREYGTAFARNPKALASDFFAALPLAAAIHYGLENSWITVSDPGLDPAVIHAVCKPDWTLRGAQNQAMIKAAGTALCLASIPSQILGGSATTTYAAYIEAVWDDFAVRAQGDTTENAPQYNVIFLSGLWVLVNLNQTRCDWLQKSANAFNMFMDFANQVSPLGILPSYGDDGLGTPLVFAGDWASVLALAAKLYAGHVTGSGDMTAVSLLEAAAYRVWQFQTSGPLTTKAGNSVGVFLHPVRSTQPLFHMALLAHPTWADLRAGATAAVGANSAATRAIVTARVPQTPDKVIVTATDSSDAGNQSLFACASVYSSPFAYHAHAQQLGTMAMLSMNDAVLLYGLGYNNRLQNQSNTMVLVPRQQLSMPSVMNGIWQSAMLPTENLEPYVAGMSFETLATGLLSLQQTASLLRNFNRTVTFRVQYRGPGTGKLTVRNLRLVSGAGEERAAPLLASTGMRGASDNGAEVAFENCGGDAVAFNTYALRNGSVTFSVTEYPYVAFDWKFEVFPNTACEPGKPPPAGAGSITAPSYTLLIFRASPSSLFDINVLTDPMPRPRDVEAAPMTSLGEAGSSPWQAAARYRIRGYGTADTIWTRELFLSAVAERTLLVRDTVECGDALLQRGYASIGPVWNFLGTAYQLNSSDRTVYIRGFPNAVTKVAHDDRLVAEVRVRSNTTAQLQVSNTQLLWANVRPVVVRAQAPITSSQKTLRFETTIRLVSESPAGALWHKYQTLDF